MTLGTLERRRMALTPTGERWCRRCQRRLKHPMRFERGRLLCRECLCAERALNTYWRRLAESA